MTEINPFASPPVFRYEDVLTPADLDAIKHGYIYQFESAPWYKPLRKLKYLVAVGTINSVIEWLNSGKPIAKKEIK